MVRIGGCPIFLLRFRNNTIVSHDTFHAFMVHWLADGFIDFPGNLGTTIDSVAAIINRPDIREKLTVLNIPVTWLPVQLGIKPAP